MPEQRVHTRSYLRQLVPNPQLLIDMEVTRIGMLMNECNNGVENVNLESNLSIYTEGMHPN